MASELCRQKQQSMHLNGNKILITGATSGIGKVLAERFSALDNQIIAVGRNLNKLETLAQTYNQITPYQCDLSIPEEVEALIQFIRTGHQDLNVLINNAGIQYNCLFEDSQYGFKHVVDEIQVNLVVPIHLSKAMLPLLTKNPNAAIVNVSSGLGLVPKRKSAVYCSTKAGIHIFSKSLRHQLTAVKVFEIIPPLVDTAMTKGRGKGKISPDQLVTAFIKAFRNNVYEANISKVKLLRLINRVSPRLADRIMTKTTG